MVLHVSIEEKLSCQLKKSFLVTVYSEIAFMSFWFIGLMLSFMWSWPLSLSLCFGASALGAINYLMMLSNSLILFSSSRIRLSRPSPSSSSFVGTGNPMWARNGFRSACGVVAPTGDGAAAGGESGSCTATLWGLLFDIPVVGSTTLRYQVEFLAKSLRRSRDIVLICQLIRNGCIEVT